MPPGVLNVITGSATEIGGELTSNPTVRKISFTGSTAVGKILMAQCAATVKKVSLELGGNAPFIVFDDADLDAAVEGAIASKYRNTGQTCVCANRLLVQASVYDEFASRLGRAVDKLKVGPGLDEGVNQGPLIDNAAVEKVESHIRDAVAKGATVAKGGRRMTPAGRFFEPTVLTNVTPEMDIAREETFGPVAPLFRFATEADAMRWPTRRSSVWPRTSTAATSAACGVSPRRSIRHRRRQYRADFNRGGTVRRDEGVGHRARRIEVRTRGISRGQIPLLRWNLRISDLRISGSKDLGFEDLRI